jgi:hypothetical protein
MDSAERFMGGTLRAANREIVGLFSVAKTLLLDVSDHLSRISTAASTAATADRRERGSCAVRVVPPANSKAFSNIWVDFNLRIAAVITSGMI